jgi:hypothetical protein
VRRLAAGFGKQAITPAQHRRFAPLTLLPDGHPLKTFACFLAHYARDVLTGEIAGDPWCYRPAHGERYAREALVPAREFLTVSHRSDLELAVQFGVPIEQITRRCRDLAIRPLRDIARSRRRGRQSMSPVSTSRHC